MKETCPNCGYCPYCGRGGWLKPYIYPYPYTPPWNPTPTIPIWYSNPIGTTVTWSTTNGINDNSSESN